MEQKYAEDVPSTDNHNPDFDDPREILPVGPEKLSLEIGELQDILRYVSQVDEELLRDPERPQEMCDRVQRYMILGNYDDPQKSRLVTTKNQIEGHNSIYIAYLLSDIEREDDPWEQFYLKFLTCVRRSDIFVLVAEDNDGGHELEVGEVSNEDLYILYRDYRTASIRDEDGNAPDLQREKYDAMIWKLIQFQETIGQAYPWEAKSDLDSAIDTLVKDVGRDAL